MTQAGGLYYTQRVIARGTRQPLSHSEGHRHALARVFGVASCVCCAAVPLVGQSGAVNGEWRTYGGDLGHTRYAPLDQINAANFNKLEVAWRFKTDSLGPRPEFNSRRRR